MFDTRENFNIQVGQRLKKIRSIINKGKSATLVQLSYLLGITRDKLTNYEIGRSSLPINLLSKLYELGINPMYLIKDSEEIFTKTKAGVKLKRQTMNVEERKTTKLNTITHSSNLSAAASEIPPSD